MRSRSASSALVLAGLLVVTLGGCSEYFDRRDGITMHTGEAVAANRVVHMIDPWPPASARRNIAYNGEKAATAAERYRTGKIIPPVSALTSSSYGQLSAPQQSNNQPAAQSNAGNSGNSPVK